MTENINVRKLLDTINKNLENTLEDFLFEPNDELTRSMVVNSLQKFYQTMCDSGTLYDFAIVCDQNNNPKSVINDNMLICDVWIKPMHSPEVLNTRGIITGVPCTLNLDTTIITKEDNYARYEYAMGILSRK